MHGLAGSAFWIGVAIGCWPLIAVAYLEEILQVRWRMLWSTRPDWKAVLRSDLEMLRWRWRNDFKDLVAD